MTRTHIVATATAIVLAFLVHDAHAQQSRTIYDGSTGRVSGRSHTGTDGSTTFYDSSGRVTGRTSTDSSGTTTIYDSTGRRIGTTTPPRRDPRR